MEIVKCATCGKKFERSSYEIKRSKKLGRKLYCSRSCNGGSKSNIKRIANIGVKWSKDQATLLSGNKRDEYTKFRSIFNRMKLRKRECNIDLQDLKDQWEKQNGRCVYSNVELILPTGNDSKYPKFLLASLDRIDSSKGYVKGNIQFVSITCNLAKNGMNHNQMLEFCKIMKICS